MSQDIVREKALAAEADQLRTALVEAVTPEKLEQALADDDGPGQATGYGMCFT